MTREEFGIGNSKDGRWYVTYQPRSFRFDPSGGDLGRGGGMSLTRVHCHEAGEYFIQAEIARQRTVEVLAQRDWLIREVEAAIKKRGLRKRLREIIFKVT